MKKTKTLSVIASLIFSCIILCSCTKNGDANSNPNTNPNNSASVLNRDLILGMWYPNPPPNPVDNDSFLFKSDSTLTVDMRKWVVFGYGIETFNWWWTKGDTIVHDLYGPTDLQFICIKKLTSDSMTMEYQVNKGVLYRYHR